MHPVLCYLLDKGHIFSVYNSVCKQLTPIVLLANACDYFLSTTRTGYVSLGPIQHKAGHPGQEARASQGAQGGKNGPFLKTLQE